MHPLQRLPPDGNRTRILINILLSLRARDMPAIPPMAFLPPAGMLVLVMVRSIVRSGLSLRAGQGLATIDTHRVLPSTRVLQPLHGPLLGWPRLGLEGRIPQQDNSRPARAATV